MAKQAKPKVADLVEILIQEMDKFQKVTKERNEALTHSISKLKYLKVDFNIAELEAMKQSIREILRKDFESFHAQTRKNNQELLRVHKKVSSNKLLYLSVLNILIFLSANAILYVVYSGSIGKPQLENIINENNRHKNQIEHIERFFNENQKATAKYKNWLEN